MCTQLGQLDVDTTTQSRTQVGGAGQDVAEVLVPHEAMVVLLEDLLNLADKREGKLEQHPAAIHNMFSQWSHGLC